MPAMWQASEQFTSQDTGWQDTQYEYSDQPDRCQRVRLGSGGIGKASSRTE